MLSCKLYKARVFPKLHAPNLFISHLLASSSNSKTSLKTVMSSAYFGDGYRRRYKCRWSIEEGLIYISVGHQCLAWNLERCRSILTICWKILRNFLTEWQMDWKCLPFVCTVLCLLGMIVFKAEVNTCIPIFYTEVNDSRNDTIFRSIRSLCKAALAKRWRPTSLDIPPEKSF